MNGVEFSFTNELLIKKSKKIKKVVDFDKA